MVSGSSDMYPAKSAQHISSDTKDPSTSHMRVFVGNINTAGLDKSTLQQIFCKYGFVTGISVHRGYAFVQYNSPMSARRAAEMENGAVISGQIADVNIAAEPKPNQKPFSSQPATAGAVGGGMLSIDPSSFEMNGGADYQSNAYMTHMAKVRTQGGVMRGKMGGGGVKTANSHNRSTTNKAVHSGRVVKSNKSAVKSNAKTLVSSVVNLSAVRRELVEIRDRIDALLFSINKSGGIGIDQQNIINITNQSSSDQAFNNGDAPTNSTDIPPTNSIKQETSSMTSLSEISSLTTVATGGASEQMEDEEFTEADDMSTVEVEVETN